MEMAVEDITCDQQLISTDINVTVEHHTNDERKLWLQNVIYTFRYHLVPALATLITTGLSKSLAPLQRIPLNLPSGVVRITFSKVSRAAPLAITDVPDHVIDDVVVEEVPESCVRCEVLHEPAQEPIADVIFIHGLHGGLDRTWTQGTWRGRDPKYQNLVPVRRTSSGNMYVPVLEEPQADAGRLKRTLNKIYTHVPVKIAKRSSLDNSDEVDRVSVVEQEEEEFSRCWPRDWLPQDCPGIRVIGIDYTTDQLWRPLWRRTQHRTDLQQRSKEMMDQLSTLGVGSRPIIWVGHSKGGLYIKQILLDAFHADEEAIRGMCDQTKGIMFYSVPHKGSPVADMVFPFMKRSIEVLEVQTNCEFVLNLHKRFLELIEKNNGSKPEIFSFIDTERTPVGFTSLKFIAYESADPDIGVKCDVPLDHREICKPAGRDCFLYLELVKLIRRAVFGDR